MICEKDCEYKDFEAVCKQNSANSDLMIWLLVIIVVALIIVFVYKKSR